MFVRFEWTCPDRFYFNFGDFKPDNLANSLRNLRRSLLCMGEIENFSNSFCPKVPFNNLETTKAIILRRSVNSAETESYERKRL